MPKRNDQSDRPHENDTPAATQGVNREPAKARPEHQMNPMAPRNEDVPEPDDVRAASAEAEDLQHPDEPRADPVHPGPHQDRREGQSGESGRY